METDEMLHALVTSMEKSMRKEVGKDRGKKPFQKRRRCADSARITRGYTRQRDRKSFCKEDDFTKTHFHRKMSEDNSQGFTTPGT
jgi:hypothetical protein